MLKGNLIRIAIVDENANDFQSIGALIRNISGANLSISWIPDYDAAVTDVKAGGHHVYLINYQIGEHSGLSLLQEARPLDNQRSLIFLTTKGDRDMDIQAMQNGATDYLVKSELNTEKIERAIRYALERVNYLKELKERENKYRSLFSSSRDAIFITNEWLEIAEANEAASLLFNAPNHQLTGCNLCDYISHADQKKTVLHHLSARHQIIDLPIDIEQGEGDPKSCLLSLTFQRNARDELFLHVIIRDNTAMKKAELSKMQAQKLAANERLMRIIAHEIRNPLNNICLSVEHYDSLDTHNSGEQQELVHVIQRNCARIGQSISELLNLTRTSGLDFQSYPLQDIIDESLHAIHDRVHLKNIHLSRKCEEGPLLVMADKSKLKLAFSNILINAIEAMEENPRERELEVRLYSLQDTPTVSIRDNGMGIDKENIPRLFEPFFTSKKNGIGLGLASSYSILQSHKADIEVESKPGLGTNFIIHFNAQ